MGRPSRVATAAGVLLVLVGCSGTGGRDGASVTSTSSPVIPTPVPARALPAGDDATVSRIVDGDTVVVRVGARDTKVRFIGSDTPETKDPRRPVQCFGREASARTEQLLPVGTAVRLVYDVDRTD